MLNTNLEEYKSELLELINEFCIAESLQISLDCTDEEDGFKYLLQVENKEYIYSYNCVCNGAIEYKRFRKRYAKLSLYNALSQYLNVKLPWGALTGIRPVKFAYQHGQGYGDYLRDVIGVSEEKTQLVTKIVNAQKPYYDLSEDNCDFFVGIPFCPTKCSYCSFISGAINKNTPLEEYTETVVKEIVEAKKLVKKLRSVYIGGGTPAALPLNLLEKILRAIDYKGVEYTVEIGRPDCIKRETLELLKKYGVTRICINPQTFNDKTLEIIGRKHTVEDVINTYKLSLEFGFIVNMDLIAGLPGESFEDFVYSIEKAIELSPENITVHTLSLKRGSILKETTDRLEEGKISDMISYSYKRLLENGYGPYYLYRQKYMAGNLENVGYSKPGKECVYNIDTMEEIAQNVACGANAISKRLYVKQNRIERYAAPKDVKTYLDKIDVIIKEKSKLFT